MVLPERDGFGIQDDDPELKEQKVVLTVSLQSENTLLDTLAQRISSWSKIIRVTAYLLRIASGIKGPELSVEERQMAECRLIQLIQRRTFGHEDVVKEIASYRNLMHTVMMEASFG